MTNLSRCKLTFLCAILNQGNAAVSALYGQCNAPCGCVHAQQLVAFSDPKTQKNSSKTVIEKD